MPPHIPIGPAMKAGRFAKDLTQEELAVRVRVSRQTIMSIERGESNPGFDLAFKISRALGFSLDTVHPNNPDPEDLIDAGTLSCACSLFGPHTCSICYPSGYVTGRKPAGVAAPLSPLAHV